MRISTLFSVVLVLGFTTPMVLAQSNGAISGRVTDSLKALVPGAKVLVTSVETGVQRSTMTSVIGG